MEGQYRIIYTRFWSDGFIANLDPLDRYVFLYLLTNEHTNIAGIYELPMRIMEFETGLEKQVLNTILTRLTDKVTYCEGWISIINFPKYQNVNSPTIKIAISKILANIPDKVIGYLGGMDTLCRRYNIVEESIVEYRRVKKN